MSSDHVYLVRSYSLNVACLLTYLLDLTLSVYVTVIVDITCLFKGVTVIVEGCDSECMLLMMIQNPAPGLLTLANPLPYSEINADFHVCPLPRFTSTSDTSTQKQYLDRQVLSYLMFNCIMSVVLLDFLRSFVFVLFYLSDFNGSHAIHQAVSSQILNICCVFNILFD